MINDDENENVAEITCWEGLFTKKKKCREGKDVAEIREETMKEKRTKPLSLPLKIKLNLFYFDYNV
jgi:hypothetical protein